MDILSGIVPKGDLLHEQSQSEDEVFSDDENTGTEGKYNFNGKYMFATWSKSHIDNKEEFESRLKELLPEDAKYFGCRELHEDGTPHYHVACRFARKTHWSDALGHLRMEGDTEAVRIEQPKPRQPVRLFLSATQKYCGKCGDTFGQYIGADGPASDERKRKWQEVIDEPDPAEVWKLVYNVDPRAYLINNPAIEKAITTTKWRVAPRPVKEELAFSFRVPLLMEWWKETYVTEKNYSGRPKSLIIVGDPMTGKSKWAESFGNPVVMNSGWCMKSVVPEASHVVVSDVRPAAFGFGGRSYWREVLGGKESFNARDFQQETRPIMWGFPCIWTCNFDNDPRKDLAVAEYIREVSYVVEIRNRPGPRCWGKLFEDKAIP
ncbi:MAG: hypothetical protein Q9198_004933 [Flavoplaca austrocitrina]